jgi:hypothetical protein
MYSEIERERERERAPCVGQSLRTSSTYSRSNESLAVRRRVSKSQCFFWGGQFCDSTQNGDDLEEDLAKFGYTIHMKRKILNHPPIFLATY